MSKKKHEEEHENHERWLVSYADFMTLLMAFFVVMYSVSRVDNGKLAQAAESVRWAMHMGGDGGMAGQLPIFPGPISEGGNVIGLAGGPMPRGVALAKRLKSRVSSAVDAYVMQGQPRRPAPVTVTLEEQHLLVRLAATEFFDAGQAVLRPQALPLLDAIADELVPVDRPIRVEGHTDDTPMSGGRYRDNWELSAARAAAVVSYLERAHDCAPQRLSATGYGSTRPMVQGDSPEAREQNRRVELALELEGKPAPVHRPEKTKLQPNFDHGPKAVEK